MAINNTVILDGRISQEPKLFENTDGSHKLVGKIAVTRTYADRNGEYKTDYISFQKYLRKSMSTAQVDRFAALNKGDLVRIQGTLRNNNHVDKATGEMIYETIIEADDFYAKESKTAKAERQARVGATEAAEA